MSDNTYNTKNVCTMCGRKFDEWDKQENFGFEHYVGYGSKYDMMHIKAQFCCTCFDTVLDYIIANSKHDPVLGEYECQP